MPLDDTIAAISTPMGRGGIGIVRISGPLARSVLERIFEPKRGQQPGNFTVRYGRVHDDGAIIDECLASLMLAPASYTTQDIVELSCHGGLASVRKILALALRHGARMAEPGEFTKRAFLNGRIDLSQAEAVLELIDAKTRHAQQSASGKLSGSLSKKVKGARGKILDLQAKIEVSIDFPEYEDEAVSHDEILEEADAAIADMDSLLASFDRGRLLNEGLKVAIAGKPNVGKSSLLNCLMSEDRAIVADIPGTTRDVLSELIHLGGMPLRIMDTAGIRQSKDELELMGVSKSMEAVSSADLVLWVIDSSQAITEEDLGVWDIVKDKAVLGISNKSDLPRHPDAAAIEERFKIPFISMNAKDGEGISSLQDKLSEMFFGGEIEAHADDVFVNLRQKSSLEKAMQSLKQAAYAARERVPADLVSVLLADAFRFLGEITGEEVGDDLIDKIFSDFCIGK
jgi:tRNA modification GTPase